VIGTGTVGAVEVFVLLLAAASLVGVVMRRIAVVPYSVALVVLGVAVSASRLPLDVHIDPEVLLAVLLPALVFEGAYRTDIVLLWHKLAAVILLAVPGVLITALLVAAVLNLVIGLDFGLSFLVGTMLAATDPAAILAVVGPLGTPRPLTTLVEAESLFNDGTGVVIFAIGLQMVTTADVSAGTVLFGLVFGTLASAAIGAVMGLLVSRILVSIHDHLIELTMSLVAAYGSYLIATQLHESGLIATVVCGLVLGSYGRRVGISLRAQDAIDIVWEFIGFLATTLVFLLIGLSIGIPQLLAAAGAAVATLVTLVASRAMIIYGLLGGSYRLAHAVGWARRLPRGWLHLIAWSGLRGAVSVALALSLPADLPQRNLLQGIVFGAVLLTLLIQGTTAQPLVRRLRLEDEEQPEGAAAA
jgi:CPA1 family monovalent cation:H+ antiporter